MIWKRLLSELVITNMGICGFTFEPVCDALARKLWLKTAPSFRHRFINQRVRYWLQMPWNQFPVTEQTSFQTDDIFLQEAQKNVHALTLLFTHKHINKHVIRYSSVYYKTSELNNHSKNWNTTSNILNKTKKNHLIWIMSQQHNCVARFST